jgi:hypothetical protein
MEDILDTDSMVRLLYPPLVALNDWKPQVVSLEVKVGPKCRISNAETSVVRICLLPLRPTPG